MTYNAQGIAPYVAYNPAAPHNELLLVIYGGVRNNPPQLYGEPYRYEEYPWAQGQKPNKEVCLTMARQSHSNPNVSLANELKEKIQRISASHLISPK